jgi:uncharacterized protein with NRDE domain
MGEGLEGTYNPFHLLAADGREAFLTVLDSDGAAVRPLEPGAHVICNRDPEDPSCEKTRWIQAAVDKLDLEAPLPKLFDAVVGVLSSHPSTENSFENPCVHTPEYGTRSSTVIALGEDRWRCWHAEGPPCETKFSNLTRLLDEIR